MGPSLAVLLKRAGAKRVIGVARFSDATQKEYLEANGVETISADLLADGALSALPSAPTVFLMAGFKFGARILTFHRRFHPRSVSTSQSEA